MALSWAARRLFGKKGNYCQQGGDGEREETEDAHAEGRAVLSVLAEPLPEAHCPGLTPPTLLSWLPSWRAGCSQDLQGRGRPWTEVASASQGGIHRSTLVYVVLPFPWLIKCKALE